LNEYKHLAPLYDVILYPFVRSIRRDILKTVMRLRPRKVLDVCCGTGDQLRLLKRYGIDAVGIDLSQAMISVSQKGNHAPRCFLQDATAMKFDTEAFDLAILSFALHETGWDNANDILSELYRVLTPNGFVILADYAFTHHTGFLAKRIIPFIEFMAGERHYRNFLDYQRLGGLETLIDPNRFASIQETYHGLRSIAVRLVQKRRHL
jgi:demethylmenaquinone methyltransferase/2-methoxy-6-polyprenyl-1,4-benzoquinol methylase